MNRKLIYSIYHLRDRVPRQEDLIVLSGKVSITELINTRYNKSSPWVQDPTTGVISRKLGYDEVAIVPNQIEIHEKKKKVKILKRYVAWINGNKIGWFNANAFDLNVIKTQVTQFWKELFGFYLEVLLVTFSVVMK